ncbi:MAG TPA: nodulation protein NfeD [Terriglobales bacterium]|nr:nodulation protein NfeD [Terriglobales bacterium]
MSRHWGPWLKVAGALALLAGAAGARTAAPAAGTVEIIRLDDTVNTVSAEYVTRGLDDAARRGARAVVLVLNTPGGLDTAMRTIIQKIFASPVPVVGFVAPSGARAASAGFYILLSCDVAAMAPGTNTGAAHPVLLGGTPDKIEAAKMQSDAAAFIRTIATQRHRDVDLAQKGVVESESFTEQEALAGHLIDLTAPNLDGLLAALQGREVTRLNGAQQTLQVAGAGRVEYAMSLRERVLDMDPSLAFVLLAIGGLLLYVEFTHPGMVAPGVAGLILVAVAVFALSLLPIDWAGAALLLLAVVLFALEAQYPTHGALAVGGVVSMALGGILLVDAPVRQMRVAASTAVGVALGFGAISLLLVELVVRARRHRVVTGAQGLVGETGVALTALGPEGKVRVHGEIWQAVASQPVASGSGIRVRAVRGLRLEVEAMPAQTPVLSP